MKLTRKSLREMIWKQLASETLFNEHSNVQEVNNEDVLDLKSEFNEQFEMVNEQTVLKEAQQKIEELKSMSEEFRRMKHLVDFRSPLLSKKDS